MAVKYRCTKCDRKFIEMGVAKVKSGQSCDDCHGEYLQQVGYDASQAAPRKKPALKRKRVRVPTETEVAPTLASFDEDETVMPDLDTLTSGNAGVAMAEVEFDGPEEVEVDTAVDDEEEAEGDAAAPEADADVDPLGVVDTVKPVADEEEEDDEDDD